MNNEETRLINEPANQRNFAVNNSTSSKYEPISQSVDETIFKKKPKKNGKNVTAAAAGGFVAGVASGFAGTAMASTPEAEPEITPEETETPAPDDVILANDEGVRYAHVDADSFAEAFAQAREQVGPGGVFEYEGKLYGTYTADEWNAMSPEEKVEYQNSVNEIAPAHHSHVSDSQPTSYHADSAQPAAVAVNDNMIDAAPAENDIHILGVEQVEDGAGNIMNVALVENGGDQALLIDVDNNGVIDVLIHDDNGDGIISETEVYDLSEANLQVADLAENIESQPDSYMASYDGGDDMPDYFNDADSAMMV